MKCQIKRNPWIISACIFQCNTLPDKKCSSASSLKIEIGKIWTFTRAGTGVDRIHCDSETILQPVMHIYYALELYKVQREMRSIVMFHLCTVDLLANDVNAIKVHYGKICYIWICNTINSIIACIHQPDASLCIFSGLEAFVILRTNKMRCDVNYVFFIFCICAKDRWCAFEQISF